MRSLPKHSLANASECLESRLGSELYLTDEPSDSGIGVADSDEELMDRLDRHEEMIESIMKSNREVEEKMRNLEEVLLKRMKTTLMEASTIKDTVTHIIQIVKRDKNEIIEVGKSLKSEMVDKVSTIQSFMSNYIHTKECLSGIIKDLQIQLALDSQDETDKSSIALFGISNEQATNSSQHPVKIDKNCISCSTHKNIILKSFKMACLNYNPSEVKFEHKQYPRKELLKLRIENLKQLGVNTNLQNKSHQPKIISRGNSPKKSSQPQKSMKLRYKQARHTRCNMSIDVDKVPYDSIDSRAVQGLRKPIGLTSKAKVADWVRYLKTALKDLIPHLGTRRHSEQFEQPS